MPKKKNPTILAIESSADETGAAVISVSSPPARRDRGRMRGGILSNIVYSQIKEHSKTGGIVPEVAARAHIPKIIPAIKAALQKAKIKLADIDAIAVTHGPGLVTSLLVGIDTAKALAFALDKPIIPINHLEGHLLSALHNPSQPPLNLRGGVPPLNLRGGKGELFPAVGLVVSGGHTMLVLVKAIGQYKILGETLDDAAGEAFDKIAKIMGIGYPGGPEIARLAEKGDPKKYEMPRPMLDKPNYDFSFSGLKTHVLYLWCDISASSLRGAKRRGNLKRIAAATTKVGPRDDITRADISAGVQQAIVEVLTQKTIRAAKEHRAKSVLLGGGVAANKSLRDTLKAESKKATVYGLLSPDCEFTTDNAGMIALAAAYHFQSGDHTTYDKVKIDPNLKLKSWK